MATARLSEISEQCHDHTQPNDPETCFDQHPTRKPEILQRGSRIYVLTSTSTLRMKYTRNIHMKVKKVLGLRDYECQSICQFLYLP